MSELESTAVELLRVLRGAGFTAYLAGGCVRDMLLGRPPKDYDIATDARPGEVLRLFPNSRDVGAHFGVILVRRRGFDFEIATFREDGIYRDGRHPDSVTFASPVEDARRRDFTVNGMFFDPLKGEVIDHVGGRDDLQASVVRAIGDPDRRFEEDHLRLLRAVRFASQLGFEIEAATWEAVRRRAPLIRTIAPERVRDEFVKTMLHPNRIRGFDLLVDSGLMAVILPEIVALKGCEQPPQWHPEGDVFVHTRLMVGLLPEDPSLELMLSVLLHDIGKPATFSYDAGDDRIRFNGHDKVGAEMAREVLHRLRFPNQVVDRVVEAVANHMMFKDVPRMRVSRLKRFMARPGFDDELELHRIDCVGSNGMLDNYEFLVDQRAAFANAPLIPPPLVTGRDLIERGHRPGPAFKEILNAIQNLQLEGSLGDRNEAIAYLEANFPPPEA